MEFINNYKDINTNQYLHNQLKDKDPKKIETSIIKIDSKDRNTNQYPNPYSFQVRFNINDNKKDKFGNSGPIIFEDYDNIINFDILHVSIPKYTYKCNKNVIQNTPFINVYESNIINFCGIYDSSELINLGLLKKDDIFCDDNKTEYKVLEDTPSIYNNLNHDYLVKLDRLPSQDTNCDSNSSELKLKKKKIILSIFSDISSYEFNSDFDLSFIKKNDKIIVENKTYEVCEDVSFNTRKRKYIINVNKQICEEICSDYIYFIPNDKRFIVSYESDTPTNNIFISINNNTIKRKIINKDLYFFDDTEIAYLDYPTEDAIVNKYLLKIQLNDLIYLKDYDDNFKFYRIVELTNGYIKIGGNENGLSFPPQELSIINKDKSINYEITNTKNEYIDTFTHRNFKYFTTKIFDFTQYVCGTIIELSLDKEGVFGQDTNLDSNDTNYEYDNISSSFWRIEEILSSTLIKVVNLFEDVDITDLKLIKSISFWTSNNYFTNSINSDFRYLILEIDEINLPNNTGTNELLNKAACILLPSGGNDKTLNLKPINNINYQLRRLNNIKKLTFKIKDPEGNILKNEELNDILDLSDSRHPLNSNNQVQILIKISKLENNF